LIFIIAVIKLIIILCVVATIHEFGHFIAAKALKIGVNEFSIGFGPKIIQKKYKETMYSLRWIPLGGYVMIEGEG
jgi:regulator of sigma E protease